MNATRTNNDSHAETAPTDFDGRENLKTVETPATLRHPNPNGDGELPTGSPLNKGAAKKRLTRTLAAAAALAVALVAGAYYYWFVLPFQDTDDAFIEGYVVPIAPKVPGYVAQLLIKDNQWVKKGDVLLQIDPRDYETSVTQARADLTAARSQLDQSQAQVKVSEAKVAQAQSAVVAAEAENHQAADDLKRYESVDKNAVSRSAFDAAQSRAQTTQANLQAARSQVQEAESEVTLCQAGVETASAAVQQAQARLHQAELNLSYTKVVAPEDGRVTRRAVEEGAYVQPGQALMAVVPRQYWVTANFKETQLTHMRPGQPVTIRVDAYPQFKLKGHVDSIQSGSGARFSLFPPENATGNYIKVVQRVPVKIVFDDTILDAAAADGVAYAALDGSGAAGPLALQACTVVGKVHATLLTLVSNTIFWGHLSQADVAGSPPGPWTAPLLAERKQAGCVRFSFLPAKAVVPRHFECVEQGPGLPQPLFASLRYGQPGYAKLLASTPDAIRRGADDGGEMGAFHFLLAPLREDNLRTRAREYLPVGLEYGIIYET